jgi:hypothetical protein
VTKIRCAYESDFFPEDDFDERSAYGLVHVRNLRAGAAEHTVSGYPIGDGRLEDVRDWAGPGAPPRPPNKRARLGAADTRAGSDDDAASDVDA